MNRNVWIILISSALFNICLGIYDFVLPYYLRSINISYANMGLIFAVSAILIFFLRLWVGSHSDRIGRKPFYSLGLAVSGVSILLTPLLPGLLLQAALKTLREASLIVRDTMRSILVYENVKTNYHGVISKIIGIEFFLQGAGTLLCGILMSGGFHFLTNERFTIEKHNTTLPLLVCGIILFAAFIFFSLTFKENYKRKEHAEGLKLKDLLKIDLPRELRLLTATNFIFTLGLSISHSFYMPLFFSEKFGIGATMVAMILMIHRSSLGIPMFIYGNFIKRKHFKSVYIITMLYEGLAIAVAALIPNFWIATGIWLTHDLLGAAFWSPIQNTYIQEFAREKSRGKDTSEVIAIGSLGGIIGPILAGMLVAISPGAVFLTSGIVTMLSVIPLFRLKDIARNSSNQ